MRGKSLAALGFVLVALTLASSAPANGERLVVDDDKAQCPQAQFTSIQAAVTAAPAGATVFVCAGTYIEEVHIHGAAKNGLKVMGEGPDKVVLDGNGPLHHGFFLEDVSGVLVQGFLVREYHDDIVLLRADGNIIRGNETTAAAGHDGIIVDDSDHNLIEDNVSHDNVQDISCGISVGHGSMHNVVRDNLVYGNRNFGLLAGFPPALGGPAGPGNVFVDNVSRDNQGHGIGNNDTAATRITDNLVLRNGSRDNARHGINVFGPKSTDVSVSDNEVVDSVRDGIFFRADTAGNQVVGNESAGSGEHDCHDDSIGSGTAGTANTWRDNEGQTENRPGLCGDDEEGDDEESDDEEGDDEEGDD